MYYFYMTNNNILVKPINKQIISYYPMERVELDLTKLSKIYPKNKSKYIIFFYDVSRAF